MLSMLMLMFSMLLVLMLPSLFISVVLFRQNVKGLKVVVVLTKSVVVPLGEAQTTIST